MKTINDTSFPFAPITGRLDFPRHSLTLIAKGTFNLMPGKKALLVEDPPFPTGDEFYPNDEDRKGSPRYESDFAIFKPNADLLLIGKCYAPGGKATQISTVTFRVGDRGKTLSVFGNRRWEKRWFRRFATEPEPFTEMELRYENSFGGEKNKNNPVGKGGGPTKNDRGNEVWQLPNLEDPADPIKSPKSRPDPAGFGPLGRMWQTRHAKTGRYSGKYLESRWPWFPEDFDWSHFNAAPEDMQVSGYLRGDEELYFENLNPIHDRYYSQLPGLRVRCFLNKVADVENKEPEFTEVPMNLDTLWVDMDAEKLVLVWRGWAEVLSQDYEEVKDLFIMSEPLEEESNSLEECHRRFLDKKAEEENAWEMESEEPGEAPEEPETSAATIPSVKTSRGIDPAYLQAQTNAILAQMGINPESLPPEAKENQVRLIQKLTETDAEKVAELQQQELDTQMQEVLTKLHLDPDNLPPLSAKAKAEQLRFIKELGVNPADIMADPESRKFWDLVGAILPKVGMDSENLDPLIKEARRQQERLGRKLGIEQKEDAEAAKDKEAPPLKREEVQERAALGDSFAGENLRGTDLSELNLESLDFSEANLAGANLTRTKLRASIFASAVMTAANLSGADLSEANLAAADLSECKLEKTVLKDADLAECILIRSTLTGAVLTDSVFERAQMAGAVLDQVEATDANFSEADLTESCFHKSTCSRADFSKAVLDRADFQGAELREASLEGALGRKINLAEADLTELRASEGCDLTDGILWNANGPGSIWEKANLTGSDFRGSRMEGATFTGACLNHADLSATDMRFSRFNKASLRKAKLVQMNLFQGSLEKADLSGADLSGSNMYGVEFLDAVIEGMLANGTNLKNSKLQKMMTQT
jgi:uncharacterized protein YjbI with pentapeptide repeats